MPVLVFLFSEFEDTLSMGNHHRLHSPRKLLTSFLEAAGHWLKEAGERNSFFEGWGEGR